MLPKRDARKVGQSQDLMTADNSAKQLQKRPRSFIVRHRTRCGVNSIAKVEPMRNMLFAIRRTEEFLNKRAKI